MGILFIFTKIMRTCSWFQWQIGIVCTSETQAEAGDSCSIIAPARITATDTQTKQLVLRTYHHALHVSEVLLQVNCSLVLWTECQPVVGTQDLCSAGAWPCPPRPPCTEHQSRLGQGDQKSCFKSTVLKIQIEIFLQMHLMHLRSWPNCKFEISSDCSELGTALLWPFWFAKSD